MGGFLFIFAQVVSALIYSWPIAASSLAIGFLLLASNFTWQPAVPSFLKMTGPSPERAQEMARKFFFR